MGENDLDTRVAMRRVGTVIRAKWRIDALIGIGGMGAVYAATHRNGQRGALKLLHGVLGGDPAVRERFLREGYVANQVDHPGVVSVLDDDESEDGVVFLVMELLEGVSVSQMLTVGGYLGPDRVVPMAIDLLDVLAAAHARGIVHRDIKPENLFLTRTGQLKVLDFGIARLRDAVRGNTGAGKTRTGEAMGTPAFMPPEQALGEWERVDARSDIWAVGATLFNLLTGKLVHEESTVQRLMLAAMTKNARSIGSLRSDLPSGLVDIIDKSLRFDPAKRFASAEAMQAALRALPPSATRGVSPNTASRAVAALLSPGNRTNSPVSSDKPTTRPKRSVANVALAVAGVLMAAVVAVVAWPSGGTHTAPVANGASTPASAVEPAPAQPAPSARAESAPASATAAPGGDDSGHPAPSVEPAVVPSVDADSAPAPAPSASARAAEGPRAPPGERSRPPVKGEAAPKPRSVTPRPQPVDPLNRW